MQLHSKLLVAALITCATVSTAAGQQPARTDPAFARHSGIMVGFGVGFGTAIPSCDGCKGEISVGLDLHLGGFIHQRLALMYDVGIWADSENDVTLVVSSNAVAAQYWVTPRLWIKGGAGLSLAQVGFGGGSDSESGLAITGGWGYEITRSGNFNTDISGRLSILDFDGGSITIVHALFGFRWK